MRMNASHISRQAPRLGATRPTNVSLDASLVADAKSLGVNISAASAQGLEQAVAKARSARWLADNKEALEASNAHVETQGLPLRHLRRF